MPVLQVNQGAKFAIKRQNVTRSFKSTRLGTPLIDPVNPPNVSITTTIHSTGQASI